MLVLSFLTQLFGATMLLLFAVRMVRTGIERAFGARFRRLVTSTRGPTRLVPIGVMLAIVLQSSAAVTLLVAGFAAGGVIGFVPGIALVLGGDLGSALLIQVLSLKLDWLAPVLLMVGGILFLKTERRSLRQAGRIILGIALILLSLDLLRNTMEPIRDSAFLPSMSAYLERDYLTAFMVGGALAFVMHSSVAAILMCVTVVAIGALPFAVGVSLVLGANLGSALIPVWLCRGFPAEARRIPAANLVIRGAAALCALFVLNGLHIPFWHQGAQDAQQLVLLHIGFNASLLITLPFCGWLEKPMAACLPMRRAADGDHGNPAFLSVLKDNTVPPAPQALANLRREVLRMAGIVSDMFGPVITIYAEPDPDRVKRITERDEVVNVALDGVRRYASALPADDLTRQQRRDLRALVDYAIALEAAGDIIVKRLLPLAEEMHEDSQRFSPAGRAELEQIHASVMENLKLATNILISRDVESARALLEGKTEMKRLERNSRKQHLKRLSQGDVDSFSTSDKHVETAYLMKEFNSWIVTVAHPILEREGELLESRLAKPPAAGHPAK
ncbi:Na/Pi cotransporter family protein [Pseudohalocynthiibacter aestuariivivens]|nr:Na/Pi cotransporter family protein [Pseudohalocynthiibacter aestuariivivens]QIE46574.1 Na/Pi cotransporter family protein [Pseudohalocynthiibacter aestuariivivens]